MLLYDSYLHLFLEKLWSRWVGPYVVVKVFPHGAVEIRDPSKDLVFKVNRLRLKSVLEPPGEEDVECILLRELIPPSVFKVIVQMCIVYIRAWLLKKKEKYYQHLLIRIALNVKESFQSLNPFQIYIQIQSSLKFRGIKLHIPQIIFIVSWCPSSASRKNFILG